jgi:tripartite-type tricarboxylate transporter receptor subunit TctC
MEKGEVEGFCGIGWTYLKMRKSDWVADKKFNILFQMPLERHSDIRDVPTIREFARDEEQRQVLDFLSAPLGMGRPFFAPPLEAPVARVLRDAFVRTLKDPVFIAEAEKSGLEITAVHGEDVQKLIKDIYATPAGIVERAKALLAD